MNDQRGREAPGLAAEVRDSALLLGLLLVVLGLAAGFASTLMLLD